METNKNLFHLLPCLFDNFRLDFSERLDEKRKNRKIQKKKFLKEKTNKTKKKKKLFNFNGNTNVFFK